MNSDGIPIHNGKVLLTSTAGVAVYADTLPAPTDDENGRKGWLYKKTAGAEKLNYYFYSQGSKSCTLDELEDVYFVGIIDTWTNVASVPFVVIYTKPLGDGQDGGAWWRTKRTFSIHAESNIVLGMRTQFSIHENPTPRFPFENIRLNQVTVVGPNVPSEEILTISVHTDSAGPNNTQVLISHVGWRKKGNGIVNPNILLSA